MALSVTPWSVAVHGAALPSCFRVIRAWRPLEVSAVVDAYAWEQPTIRVFGRTCKVPRLTAWEGPHAYAYSGHRHEPAPLSALTSAIVRDLETVTGVRFDSVLANHYRDGSDSVAWHCDDEPELGPSPTIASLSIGAPRAFAIRRKSSGQTWRVMLGGGDLLVMSGNAQRDYLHAVPKTAKPIGPRITLSFRALVK